MREQWKTMVARTSPSHTGGLWMVGSKQRVCSLHFIHGEPTAEKPVPTLHMGYHSSPRARKIIQKGSRRQLNYSSSSNVSIKYKPNLVSDDNVEMEMDLDSPDVNISNSNDENIPQLIDVSSPAVDLSSTRLTESSPQMDFCSPPLNISLPLNIRLPLNISSPLNLKYIFTARKFTIIFGFLFTTNVTSYLNGINKL